MKTFVVRFWINDKRVKPSMRLSAQDVRDAAGQVYSLLSHPEVRYSSEDGGVEVRLQTGQITDYVVFVKAEPPEV